MASDDISQLADALSKTHVGDGELSIKGLGLKLDSGEPVEELVREIEQFEGLRALRLEGNTLGVEAAQAIAKALESKDLLQRCYWSDMFTGRLRSEIPAALEILGHALMNAGTRLTVLDLSDNAFGPDGVKGIEQLLKSASCHTLGELSLNNCGMGVGGGKILAEALTESHRQSLALGTPLKLRVFVAGRNRLENEGARALAKTFQLMGSLEEIQMPQNGINHAGVIALASAVRQNPELRVLNLNDNSFTKKGTLAMAQALKHLRNIQVLNFGDCLIRSEGAIALAAVLREGLPILKELNLSYGEITEAAALVVAQAVTDKPHIENVDLNGNCLGEKGCEALREIMENADKSDVLGSLSDDEGEPEDDGDDENTTEDDDDDDDDDDETNGEYNEEDKESDENEEENGTKSNSPAKHQSRVELTHFLSCPSTDKLLQFKELHINLEEQVDPSEPNEAAEVLLKIGSLYNDNPEEEKLVIDVFDAVLQKLLTASTVESYCVLSALLVMMGLLKGEEKTKKVLLVPSQLLCLEHAVQQDYFSSHHISLLNVFLSRNSGALKSCGGATQRLKSAVEERCHKQN